MTETQRRGINENLKIAGSIGMSQTEEEAVDLAVSSLFGTCGFLNGAYYVLRKRESEGRPEISGFKIIEEKAIAFSCFPFPSFSSPSFEKKQSVFIAIPGVSQK